MLITVCPDCETSFFLTQEQLAFNQGEVKCGQCGLSFNAEAHRKTDVSEQELQAAEAETVAEVYPVSPEDLGNQPPEQLSHSGEDIFSFELKPSFNNGPTSDILHPRDYLSTARNDQVQQEQKKLNKKSGSIFTENTDLANDIRVHGFPATPRSARKTEEAFSPLASQPAPVIQTPPASPPPATLAPVADLTSAEDRLGNLPEETGAQPDETEAPSAVLPQEPPAAVIEIPIPITLAQEEKTSLHALLADNNSFASHWATYACLTTLVVLLGQLVYFALALSQNITPPIQTISSTAVIQNNQLRLNIEAITQNPQAKPATLYLTLQNHNQQTIVAKAIKPEEYLPHTLSQNGHLSVELNLNIKQAMQVNNHTISWQ